MSQEPPKRRGPLLVEITPAITPAMPPTGTAPPHPAPRDHAGDAQAAGDTRSRRAPRSPEAQDQPSPADAPVIDAIQPTATAQPRAMMLVSRIAGWRTSGLTRFFINSGVALLTFVISVAALRFLSQLLATYPLLGWIGIALFAVFSLATLAMGWREIRAWSRFAVIDRIRRKADQALAAGDVVTARQVGDELSALYADRPELAAARANLARHRDDAFEAQSLLALAEADLLADLDQQARREVEAAARVGIAAIEVCRPLPFIHQRKPTVGGLLSRGLKGLFGPDEPAGKSPTTGE